jgi:hypothetical protein
MKHLFLLILGTIAFILFIIFFTTVAEIILANNKSTLHEWLHPTYYTHQFPDYAFPPLHPEVYWPIVDKGRHMIEDKTIVVCGLAHNIRDRMHQTFSTLIHAVKNFQDYRIIIFENDSDDNTREAIIEYTQQNKKVELILCSEDEMCKLKAKARMQNVETRMHMMADYRNRYLDRIYTVYKDWDYMMVVDMDLHGTFSENGFFHTMGLVDEWDACACYGLMGMPALFGDKLFMYDGLAYVDINNHYGFLEYARKIIVLDTIVGGHAKVGDPLLPCRSAFNGMCIYKINQLNQAQYDGGYCEHVTFHEQLYHHNPHFRFYIDPSWVLLSGRQGPVGWKLMELFGARM